MLTDVMKNTRVDARAKELGNRCAKVEYRVQNALLEMCNDRDSWPLKCEEVGCVNEEDEGCGSGSVDIQAAT
jgi:hypothetical protein